MEISAIIDKNLNNVIDTNVKYNNSIIGTMVEYEKDTGLVTIECTESGINEVFPWRDVEVPEFVKVKCE